MNIIPGLPPFVDVMILSMMLIASLLNLSAWRSPRARGGEPADVIRALKASAWGVFFCWFTFLFVENDLDLKMSAIIGVGFFLLAFADILGGVIAMNRAKDPPLSTDEPGTMGGPRWASTKRSTG